jgi:hypothetical protein
MRLHAGAIATLTAAVLLASMPTLAAGPESSVSFDGIGFDFDRSLGASVNILQVPGQRPSPNAIVEPDAAHLAFTLYGRRDEATKIPRAWVAPEVLRFYRTSDLAGYDLASQQLVALGSMLSERPDLAAAMTVTDQGIPGPLPFLPIVDAGQGIVARAQYVDTPQLAGIAYLTAFRQDVWPFAANEFLYTFQGLSDDGQWYVAADFLVDASMFPDKVKTKEGNRIASSIKRYTKYLRQSVETLNGASPDAFSPPLTSIDALIMSITFEGVPATEPSPLPSTGLPPVSSPLPS